MGTLITIFATHPVVTTAMTLKARLSRTEGLQKPGHIVDDVSIIIASETSDLLVIRQIDDVSVAKLLRGF